MVLPEYFRLPKNPNFFQVFLPFRRSARAGLVEIAVGPSLPSVYAVPHDHNTGRGLAEIIIIAASSSSGAATPTYENKIRPSP